MELLNEFHQEWFNNPNWWFSKNDEHDKYITQKYYHLLESKYTFLANPIQTILIYDQLPRHIYRNEYASHIIHYYLEKAVSVVKQYIYSIYYNTLTPIEWTFFMLPLRHTKENRYIFQVLEETWKRIENDKNNIQIYKRFLKATYNRLLNDNINQTNFINIISPSSDITNDDFKSILYYSPETYLSPDDIISSYISFDYSIIDITKPVIISLSGGVDSMVTSLLVKKHYTNCDIIALHICYDNRDECDKEVIFLKHWCSHLNIPLYIRKISEIHRKPCMQYELRELYESYTRDVRYSCYKSITEDEIPQVILGHNSGDVIENIMTNIAHKNKYDNLYGMSPVCIQDDIKFLRPLLQTAKEDIIKFAHENSIPYLPNSTPTWSQRGQIRNNIIPVLDKWDKKFVPSLFNLSNTMTSLYNIMQNAVNQFIYKGMFNETNTIFIIHNIDINELINDELYWREIFIKIYKTCPSTKSIENLVLNLNTYIQCVKTSRNQTKRKFMISKSIVLEVTSNNNSFVDITITKIK